MTKTKLEIVTEAFGGVNKLNEVLTNNRDNICDYLRLPKNAGIGEILSKATNYLLRRAGADLVNDIDVLDPVTYCEELTGKTDPRVEHLLRPFDEGEDLDDVYQC